MVSIGLRFRLLLVGRELVFPLLCVLGFIFIVFFYKGMNTHIRELNGKGYIILPSCGMKEAQSVLIKKLRSGEIKNMKKKVSIYLSDDEYEYLVSKSKVCDCTINNYIKRKALDRTDSIRLQNEAALLMTDLYRWSQMTEDIMIRSLLVKGGDRLCQCLRW